jgi:hypothetical protein
MSDPLSKIKTELNRKAAAVQQLLNNPVGKELIQILEDQFTRGELFAGADTHKTAYNLGARDVVVYLRQLADFGERNAP